MAEDHETPYGGEFPDVRDEAAASPRWLPGIGFAILCVLTLFLAYRAATAHEEAVAGQNEGDATAEATDEAAPADPEPSPAEGPQ
jgi:hypothetical protein